MPTFQIEDAKGRILEIEGDREPTADELTNLFSQSFAEPPAKQPSFISRGLTAFGEAMAGHKLPEAGKPAVTVPRFGEPGTVTRGISEGVAGLVEGATTPEGIAAAGLLPIPGVGRVVGTTLMAAGAKAAAQLAGEASVTGDKEKIAEASVIGLATALGGVVEGAAAMRAAKAPVAPKLEEIAPVTAAALKEEAAKPSEQLKPVEEVKPSEAIEKPVQEKEGTQEVAPETDLPAKPAAESEVPIAAEPIPAAAGKVEPAAAPDPFSPEALTTPQAKTLGVTPGSGKVSDLIDFTKSEARRWLTVRGHLPPEVQALKREMEGKISSADLDVKISNKTLMDALSEHYGLNALQRAGGGSRKIPVAAVETMNAYLKGQVANPATIPPVIRGALDTMRAEIDSWSQKVSDKLVQQAGRHPAGSPEWQKLNDLSEKIRNNMDVYVHRSYKFFDSKKPAPKWYADLPLGIRDSAEQFVAQNRQGMTVEQARSNLLDWLSDLRDESSGGTGGSKLGAKDLSLFMRKKVIAPEIRAVLGEYQSPLVNYAKSVSKMASWLAKQKFLEDVRAQGMGTFLFEEGVNPPGFNARIAAEGSQPMSPLSGLRTTDEIAKAFKEMDAVPTQNTLARGYLMLNGWTKFAATGLSVLTQARNLLSRPMMATWAGHWDATKVPEAVRLVVGDVRGKAGPAVKAKLARARELNILDDSGQSAEIRAVLRDADLQEVAPGELYSWSVLRALKHYGYRVPADFYRASDNIGSLVGWMTETETQAKINPALTTAQAEAKAAGIVREIYPFYSETWRSVKELRRVPLTGPFVTFPYQMIRVIWNGLARSVHEIRSSNPTEQAVGTKRLASQLATITAAYGMQEAGKAALGISTQQEDDFRRFQPPWSRNSKWLFTSKEPESGELGAVNLSYMDPFSYATDPTVATLRSLREGKDMFEVFAETTREMLSPWINPQMLAKALIEVYNGKTDTGREIFNQTDGSWERFVKKTAHVMTTFEPGTMQRTEKRILPAARNEQPLYGRKLELAPEIARELTGIAVEKFNFKNGLAFKAREFTELDTASERIFHETVSRTQTTTPADMLEAYKASDARRFEIWQEMRRDFLAAVRNGVGTAEAQKTMAARGVSKRDARFISQGVYMPMAISSQARKRAVERKRVLPLVEIRAYQTERRLAPLDAHPITSGE